MNLTSHNFLREVVSVMYRLFFSSHARVALMCSALLWGTVAPAATSPTAWMSDIDGNLGTVHVIDGEVHNIGPIHELGTIVPIVMTDIAVSYTGNLYGVSIDNVLYRINPFNAISTRIGSLGAGVAVNSLTFDSDGTLYAAGEALYRVNVATGAATLIGHGGAAYNSSGDLAIFHDHLYLTSHLGIFPNPGERFFELNKANGVGTDIGPTNVDSLLGLATDNTVLYGLAGNNVYTMDTVSGHATLLVSFNGPDSFGQVYGATMLIPEPETYALMLAGLSVLGFAARSRKQETA